nr:SDR family oxidoreductase [Glycomyces mayteni]
MNDTPAVLLTGANGGIGTPTALELARRGFLVYAGVRRTGHGPFDGADGIRELRLDVTDPDSVAAAIDRVTAEHGSLHAVVNNAGVIVQGPLELVPDDELLRQFAVNVLGPIRLLKAALPLLRTGRGRIVNVGAPTAYLPMPMNGPISASKAALHSLTTALRGELAAWSIPTSVVVPGLVDTEVFTKAAAAQRAAQVPPERLALYRNHLAAAAQAGAKQKPEPTTGTVRAITAAVTDHHPKAEYFSSPNARILSKLLPASPARCANRRSAKP